MSLFKSHITSGLKRKGQRKMALNEPEALTLSEFQREREEGEGVRGRQRERERERDWVHTMNKT